MEKLPKVVEHEEEKEGEEDDLSFEELGLDPRLVRALIKKGIQKPTPIQRVAIPLILVHIWYLLLSPEELRSLMSGRGGPLLNATNLILRLLHFSFCFHFSNRRPFLLRK